MVSIIKAQHFAHSFNNFNYKKKKIKTVCIAILFFLIQIKKVFLLWLNRGTLILVFGDTEEAVVAAEAVQPRHVGLHP